MNSLHLLLVAILLIALSATLTWVFLRIAVSRSLLDIPNVRSSHSAPTPRGGGSAILLTALVASGVLYVGSVINAYEAATLFVGGVLVGGAGYLDDRYNLSPSVRLTVHLVVSVASVAVLINLNGYTSAVVISAMSLVYVLGIAWNINLFNFMDGIDGLAASEAVYVSVASAILIGLDSTLAFLPLATACACVGFLFWNWPPARIFMGDVGSGFLGFWLAALALIFYIENALSIWTSIILQSVFIADATVTLMVRVVRGERWSEAHRSHAYQHLAGYWKSHRKVTTLLWVVNLLFVLPLAVLSVMVPSTAPAIAAGTLAMLAIIAGLLGAGGTPRLRAASA